MKDKELLDSENRIVYENLESKDTVDFDFDILLPNAPLALGTSAGELISADESNTSVDYAFDDIEFEFEKYVPKADRIDYAIAASCGVVSAALDILFVEDFLIEHAHSWGKEKTEDFVKAIAKHKTGYSGNDLAKAVEALEKKFPIPADELTDKFGGGNWHHLRDFGHHPTPIGLCFSILTQLTGYGFGTDTDGRFVSYRVSDNLRGSNVVEQITMGTIGWLFHMVSDMAGSSGRIKMGKEGTGLPGPIVSLLKELSSLPIAKNIRINHNSDDLELSKWISKLFNGTLLAQHDENGKIIPGTEIRFDLRTEMGIAAHLAKSAVPVIVNECIVRAVYSFRRLFQEIKRQRIRKVSDLSTINPISFLPIKSRELSRMLTISSGTFMLIVTSKDAATALVKSKGDKKQFAAYFLLNVNYFGVFRFMFACKNDASYISEDIRKAYGDYVAEKKKRAIERNREIPGLKSMVLNNMQTRIIYSLKRNKVLYDINNTKNEQIRFDKLQWLFEWEAIINEEFIIESEEFFITSELEVEEAILRETIANGNQWLFLVAIELYLFNPYFILSQATKNSKLKFKADYETDVFCNMQSVIDKKSFAQIVKTYNRFESYIAGKTAKRVVGASATVVATALTGGLALSFAPEIAVVLAGGSFAGLSGAALTSASLAAIGGGAIATGGLGMAGGTVIIAGGGTLLGFVGTGTVAMSASSILSSKERTLEECAKLLSYCELALSNDREIIDLIQKSVNGSVAKTENRISELSQSQRKEDKELCKKLKESYRYFKKCQKKITSF